MVEYSDPRDFGFRPETVMTALMPYEQYSSKTRRLILGIDMGIASVGVCLIDIRNHEIILMASRNILLLARAARAYDVAIARFVAQPNVERTERRLSAISKRSTF